MIWSNFKESAFDRFLLLFYCITYSLIKWEPTFWVQYVIQKWCFIYRWNLLQIYEQVCSKWTFWNILRLHTASFLLLLCSIVTLNMNVVSLNSSKNKEHLLIRQTFDRTSPTFWFSNVQLQHKNSQTCSMTDRYLHHWMY